MSLNRSKSLFTFLLLALVAFPAIAQEKKPPKITFDDHVKPIFQQKCFACHNPDKKSADLDLTTYTNLMQGGASGTVIEPGDSGASYLYALVAHEDEPAMPPESPKMPDAMIETIRKWIDGGVLENMGSKAKASKKKKYDLALAAPSTERPAVVPMPGRLNKQPVAFSPYSTAVDALATSPWAPLVAVGSQKQVLLYSTQTLDIVGALPFPEGTPRVLKFSRNGGLLLAGGGVGGASGRVVVWNIRNGERIIEIGSELDEVLAADISSDQTLIALGGPQRVVRIFSTDSGQLLHEIRKHTEWVTALEFSPDSVLLASGDRNGGLFVWEGWTGREYLTLKGHTKGITDVSWRSDSNILASSSEDTNIRLWEMENGRSVRNWGAHGGGAMSVEFTRDGKLFTAGRDRVAKLFQQDAKQVRAFEAFGDLALQSTYCDETNRAIAGDWKGEIRVWNAADGKRIGNLQMNAPMLESRLAEANKVLSAKKAEHKPVADAFNAAKVAFEKVKGDHAVAMKAASDAKTKSDQANNAFNAAKALLTKFSTEHAAAKKQADEMAKGMPQLKEAAEKAKAAAAAIPSDQSIAAAAKAIVDAANAKSAQLAAMNQTLQEKSKAMAQAQQDMAAKQTAAAQMVATYQTMAANEKKLQPMVKPAEDNMNGQKAKFDKLSAELNQAQQLVSRWTNEIAFSKTYTDLTNQRKVASKALEESEISQFELNEKLASANSQLATANQNLNAAKNTIAGYPKNLAVAMAAVQQATKVKADATNAKNASAANVSKINGVIAKLNEAVGKTNEAIALSKDDPSLGGVLKSIQAAVLAKAKQLETAKADLIAKTTAETNAANDLKSKQDAANAVTVAKANAEKMLPALTAAVAPLQKAAEGAKVAAETAANRVNAAKQKVDAINAQLAVAQGLQPAA